MSIYIVRFRAFTACMKSSVFDAKTFVKGCGVKSDAISVPSSQNER